MILYHGTTFNAFTSIRSQMKLSTTTDEISPYNDLSDFYKTTPGYVYLTDSPLAALEFASKNWIKTNKDSHCSQLLVVFEIDVDEKNLRQDEDETRIISSSFHEAKFYQYSKDIDLKKQFVKSAFFNFSSYESCCKFFSKYDNDEKINWNLTLENPKSWNGNSKTMDSIN